MKTPIDLHLNGRTVATVVSFSYETPWATGEVEFDDEALFRKLVGVSLLAIFHFELGELELDDDVEEKMWEAKLSELGILWEDLDLDRDGRWSITPNGCGSQPIYAVRFYDSGYMDWRL